VEEITDEGKKLVPPLWLDTSYSSRLVVHTQTTEQAINDLIDLIRRLKGSRPSPAPPTGGHHNTAELTPADKYRLIYQRRPGIGFS
jgi:hypothetical protein